MAKLTVGHAPDLFVNSMIMNQFFTVNYIKGHKILKLAAFLLLYCPWLLLVLNNIKQLERITMMVTDISINVSVHQEQFTKFPQLPK